MLRFAVLVLFIASTTSQPRDERAVWIEFLQHFNNPALGDNISNMIRGIQNPLTTETPEEVSGSAEVTVIHQYGFTNWTDFGECSKICGGGSRSRSRRCLDETGTEHPVLKCFEVGTFSSWDLFRLMRSQSALIEIDEELCNKRECAVSNWSYPSTCSHKCGGGVMTYSRTCLESEDQSKCNFESKHMTPCNNMPCFKLGEWKPWSSCTRKCGGGKMSRSRACEPNFPDYSPLYKELKYALDHVSQPQLINTIDNVNEAYYFGQYLANCAAQTVEVRHCNWQACPACPKNQEWHQCKPCIKICKSINFGDLSSLSMNFDFSFDHPLTGCEGVCESGCGCPLRAPLMDYDGGCYMLDFLCPQNSLTNFQRSNVLIQALMGGSLRPTSGVSGIAGIVTTPAMSRATTKPSTTPDPYVEGIKLPCPYNVTILDREACECHGAQVEVTCVGPEGAQCPIICRKQMDKCPNFLGPRVKSASACETPRCEEDDQCPSRYKCCMMLCGKRCVSTLY